jgi:cyclase
VAEGGNIGLFVTERAAVLVDDQFEKLVPGLLRAIQSVTSKPLRYVVNTHHHGDHTGGNAALEKQVHAVVSHVNVRRRLALAQAKLEPAKRGGLPSITFGEEEPSVRARMNFHLDGLELHLVHYAAGHTDGDVLVGAPSMKVLHMGDLFFNGLTPFVDVDAGGSLAGMIANVESVLSWVPDDVRIIPGHGPMAGKKDLARFRDFLRAVQRTVEQNPGKSGAEMARAFDRAAFPDYQDLAPFLTWEKFFERVAMAPGKK